MLSESDPCCQKRLLLFLTHMFVNIDHNAEIWKYKYLVSTSFICFCLLRLHITAFTFRYLHMRNLKDVWLFIISQENTVCKRLSQCNYWAPYSTSSKSSITGSCKPTSEANKLSHIRASYSDLLSRLFVTFYHLWVFILQN